MSKLILIIIILLVGAYMLEYHEVITVRELGSLAIDFWESFTDALASTETTN